jgi:large subunit ribosomal protein L32
MPVPKRKLSRARRDSKHANKYIRPQSFAACSNCSVAILPHIACAECGFYKGRKVMSTKTERAVKRAEVRASQPQQNEQGLAASNEQK